MNFGTRLKQLRLERGLSQKTVAESLGVSINAVSQYENGKRFPDEKLIVEFCEFYNISADYLFGLSGSKDQRSSPDMQGALSEEQKQAIKKVLDLFSKEIK